jgi:hypothetical protein
LVLLGFQFAVWLPTLVVVGTKTIGNTLETYCIVPLL